MQTNRPILHKTFEGAPACQPNPKEQLRRSVLSCLLFESTFYEDGVPVANRIARLVDACPREFVEDLAFEARTSFKLRHVPLLLMRELFRLGRGRAEALHRVIKRPDELTEFLALYWQGGRRPLAAQAKKGLAAAFAEFDEYQLAKYNRAGPVKLRDVMFLVHPKPRDEAQADLWRRLASGDMKTPDTWEVALSGGGDKKEEFTRLIRENKLGILATLRNLRNMRDAGVDESLVAHHLVGAAINSAALPFRFIAAARACPQWEPMIDAAMQVAMEGMDRIGGRTNLLLDVSGSMQDPLSSKSDMSRMDAMIGLAILIVGLSDSVQVWTFSESLAEIPPRKGMALGDAVIRSQRHLGTYMGAAVRHVMDSPSDRLIVITDEQSRDPVPAPAGTKGYIINVAPHQVGVGYGPWMHINGFSEAAVRFIQEAERMT